jgi:hypothetical protein
MRSLLAVQAFSPYVDGHGNGRKNVAFTITDLSDVAAPVYTTEGGSTQVAVLATSATKPYGVFPGWMAVGTYKLTIEGVTWQVEVVSGRTAGAGDPLDGSVTLPKLDATLKPTSSGGSAVAGDPAVRALGSGGTQAAAGDDARFPSAGQKNALAGTNGTPGTGNEYLTKQARGAVSGVASLDSNSLVPSSQLIPSVFNIKDPAYGGKGDGATDDTAAFTAAVAAAAAARVAATDRVEVFFPPGRYVIKNPTITTPWLRIRGVGATIVKAQNGPVFTVDAQGVEFVDVNIWGNALTHTGTGIACHACSDFKFIGGRIEDMASFCIQFLDTGYVRRTVANCFLQLRGTPLTGAVAFPGAAGGAGEELNGDSMLQNIWCGGGDVADVSGCATVMIVNCSTRNVYFDANSKKVGLIGNRIASAGATLNVKGTQHSIAGNLIAGPVDLNAGCTGVIVGANVIAGAALLGDLVTDNSGNPGSNQIVGRATKPTARVRHNANQAIASGFVATLLFNTERYKNGVTHDVATKSGRLVFPNGGIWAMGATLAFAPSAAGARDAAIRVNGNTTIDEDTRAAASATLRTRISLGTEWEIARPTALTADTTNGSPNLANVVVTAGPVPTVGQAISGPGIPAGARVATVAPYALMDDAGAALNATATAAAQPMATNDYAEVVVYQDSGGALNLENFVAFSPEFWVSYVGARINA